MLNIPWSNFLMEGSLVISLGLSPSLFFIFKSAFLVKSNSTISFKIKKKSGYINKK